MAVGDAGNAAGFGKVPETGEEGRVRWGAREINRTRDFLAQVKALIPTGKAGFRTAAGISSGTADPSGGNDGDIYFKIIS
uniref:Minor tail protein n=1 Tax=Streptomyces phage Scarif TaxID=3158858 RepID=A0AAU7GZL1_9CAUD